MKQVGLRALLCVRRAALAGWQGEACRFRPVKHDGHPPPLFLEVLILKGFKSFVLEVHIPIGLGVCFPEVRILKGLGEDLMGKQKTPIGCRRYEAERVFTCQTL
jgi:hypothetical protein